MRKLPVLLLCAFLPASAMAWEATLSVDYVMSDGDSRITAKAHALEALRVKASERTETYIQTSTTLYDTDDLSKTIEVIGASMVEIRDYRQEFHLSDEGRSVLTATATVSVDESELRNRIDAIQRDAEKQRMINQLALENTRLRARLLETRSRTVAPPRWGYRDLLSALKKNRSNVNAIFERGTLIEMASNSRSLIDAAKRSIGRNVLSPLENAVIKSAVTRVQPVGANYEVWVNVWWNANMDAIEEELSNWFHVEREYRYLRVSNPSFHREAPFSHAKPLFDWLVRQQIMLQAAIEGAGAKIPIFYAAHDFGESCGPRPDAIGQRALRNPDDVVICIPDPDHIGERFIGVNRPTPLRLRLSKSQAVRATSVDTEIRVEPL